MEMDAKIWLSYCEFLDFKIFIFMIEIQGKRLFMKKILAQNLDKQLYIIWTVVIFFTVGNPQPQPPCIKARLGYIEHLQIARIQLF